MTGPTNSAAAPVPERSFSDEEARYITSSPGEIVAILRACMRKGTLVTAYFNGGKDFVLTAILAVNPESGEVVFDLPPHNEQLQRMLASPRVLFVTSEDGIKIKFSVDGLAPQPHGGREAVAGRIPDTVLRMQRRENYRASCLLTQPLKCRVTTTVDGKETEAELTVLDISCGGISVIDSHPHVHFEKDAVYDHCLIDLPGIGSIKTGLQVCNSFEVTLKNGSVCKRSGCRFVGAHPSLPGMVQRYIMKLERDRNPHFGNRWTAAAAVRSAYS